MIAEARGAEVQADEQRVLTRQRERARGVLAPDVVLARVVVALDAGSVAERRTAERREQRILAPIPDLHILRVELCQPLCVLVLKGVLGRVVI